MKNLTIVTSLATDFADTSFNYQLYYLNNKEKREIYWKCCVVFFASSLRYNPEAHHILYTNDPLPVVIDGKDIRKLIEDLGVEIRVLPFRKFAAPQKFSTYHTLTLFKLEIIDDIRRGIESNYILLDSDMVWIKSANHLLPLFENDSLIVYDIYYQQDVDKKMHRISRRDLGRLYRTIDPAYPVEFPVRYGGEVLAGSRKVFDQVATEVSAYYNHITAHFEHAPRVADKKILDGDEFILSMVYNKLVNPKVMAGQFVGRIWTNDKASSDPSAFRLVLWHLIAEKMSGIPLLYESVINEESDFWRLPVEQLAEYQGYFFGIPERRFHAVRERSYKTFLPKVITKIREKMNNLLAG